MSGNNMKFTFNICWESPGINSKNKHMDFKFFSMVLCIWSAVNGPWSSIFCCVERIPISGLNDVYVDFFQILLDFINQLLLVLNHFLKVLFIIQNGALFIRKVFTTKCNFRINYFVFVEIPTPSVPNFVEWPDPFFCFLVLCYHENRPKHDK